MPLRLFWNRTAALTYVLSFLHGMDLYAVCLFLPVYFQAVLEASLEGSGVDHLASAIPMVPFAIIGGIFISVVGKYKPLLIGGFIPMAVGVDLFSMLTAKSSGVVFQVILAAGSGMALIATLQAILASLPEADVATATAPWVFLRSFGSIWGVSIPSTVFNTRFTDLAYRISDPVIRDHMYRGGAYQLATREFMRSLNGDPVVQAQVASVNVDSLKLVWQVSIAFAAIGVPLAFCVKSLKLRDELDNDFGFDDKVPQAADAEKGKSETVAASAESESIALEIKS